MTAHSKTHADLVADLLGERAGRVTFSAADMASRLASLRAGFAAVDDAAAERSGFVRALEALPAARRGGWLDGVQASLKVVLGQAQRTSEILADAARDLLPVAPGAWSFAPDPLLTRSADARVTRVDGQNAGAAACTVFVDDSEGEPRFTGLIRDFAADAAPPVALFIQVGAEPPAVLECHPEVIPQAGSDRVRLRYDPDLPPGSYAVFFGNPLKTGP